MMSRNLFLISISAMTVLAYSGCSGRKLPAAGAEIVKTEPDRQVAQAKVASPPPLLPQVHEDKLEACYENFLKTKPQQEEGTLLVRWDLNNKGEVSSTKVVETELKDKKFTTCVIENLKQVHFPEASTYPKSVAHKYNFKRRSPASL